LLKTCSFLKQDVAEITPPWEIYFALLNISFGILGT
jgi:hypothetical protein